jgi:hypothetical protein
VIPRFQPPEGDVPRGPATRRLPSYRPAMRLSRGPSPRLGRVSPANESLAALFPDASPEDEAARPGYRIHSSALPRRIDRFQRSCRARPPRASPAKRHDELGHPGAPPSRWSGCLGLASTLAWERARR